MARMVRANEGLSNNMLKTWGKKHFRHSMYCIMRNIFIAKKSVS